MVHSINLYSIFRFLSLCLLASLIALLMACGDGEDEMGNLSLEGTLWIETAYTDEGCTDPNDDGSGTSVCTDSECYTVFLFEGTIVIIEHEGGITSKQIGSYTISGNTLNASVSGATFNIEFTIMENQLTISFEEPESGCTVSTTYTGTPQADAAAYLEEISEIFLEGTYWESVGYQATNCTDPADNENSTFECTDSSCEVLTLFDGEFMSVYTSDGITETTTGTYDVNGNTLTVTFDEDGQVVTIDATYEITDDTLIITFTDPFNGCDVVQTYKA